MTAPRTLPQPPAVTGCSLIAGALVVGDAGEHRSTNPADGTPIEPAFGLVGAAEVERAAAAALACFDDYRARSDEDRALFLEAVAAELEAMRPQLVERATAETGLPSARIENEIGRASGQFRLFAREVRLGAFHGLRRDSALPERTPAPRSEIEMRKIPLGPVAVFGASNFPLAFSTAGGDTASALAAGCPVIVKGHSAHAGTAELAGQAISRAAERTGMPAGVCSVLFGSGAVVGQLLAAHPAIAAIGFTGSQAAGTALMATAAARPRPVPVYAEMSSINPVVLTRDALRERCVAEAAGLVGSLTLGSGQFCTNPGLVFVEESPESTAFRSEIASAIEATTGQTMLTAGIRAAFDAGVERMEAAGATRLAAGAPGPGPNAPGPLVLLTDAETFVAASAMHEEVFGAAALLVTYRDTAELHAALDALGGQLTATVRMTNSAADLEFARALLPRLERLAGRIIINEWPTGVEVIDSMVHGGPFPATSDSRTTSVGTLAIERFLRPVAYQNLPAGLQPAPFVDRVLPGRVDGELHGS
ncbi:aldehyde dehydrogenase (NADP(+)) [Leucobacter luti]|uniref:NADP-dependent aldehyde dehydrogenase n=1 Tax=Leucobacter luti TaxID=340320 RepID=A0A4Q7U0H0_9MICO|nr:aldehyde dehydrogenase (NADP(+)) [Leucobacter luti]MBL3699366.1 aldehyde dehydrogenase (NADP(+)) [Leucobacter luti]RZT66876.1 NADP-dependent aldehyde dehydrogenase [Leucobacter luti]